MTGFIVVIPARYDSTRLPGKPLIDLAGRPMIEHVIGRGLDSGADRVIVATDDERVEAACVGAEVMRTRRDHPTGTDRLAEVVTRLALPDDCVVVNLQGDEPLMPPALLREVAASLEAHHDAAVATLSAPLAPAAVANPNLVKVVTDRRGYALYFSRAPIPYDRDGTSHASPYRLHVGVYAYRAEFLRRFPGLAACELESVEQLEQLRALWHGYRIHVAEAPALPGHGVDTLDDVAPVEAAIKAARGG